MGELADAIIDGHIAIEPFRLRRKMPCTFCGYRPICRYEIHTQPPRALESLSKTELFARFEPEAGK
jgi:ATP-dependent helicase/nuclease subunit B